MAALNGAEMESELDGLDEWMKDSSHVITYKWLSRTWSIHVNRAKELLETYLTERRTLPLTATYCLAGSVRLSDGREEFRVRVVREEDRTRAEAEFIPPVSCHVYSVQRKTDGLDAHTLYIADYELTKSNLFTCSEYSAVRCPRAVVRPLEEMIVDVKPEPVPVSTSRATNSAKLKPVDDKSKTNAVKSFFGNVQTKNNSGVKASEAPSKAAGKVATVGAINIMFKTAEADKPKQLEATKDKTQLSKNELIKDGNTKLNNMDRSEKRPSKVVTNDKTVSDDAMSKKRRRILDISSSSSEGEEEEDMDVENCDPELSIPSPVDSGPAGESNPVDSVEPENNTNIDVDNTGADDQVGATKVETSAGDQGATKYQRTLVSRTYLNSEGFMVTEKVWQSNAVPVALEEKPDSMSSEEPVPTPAADSATSTGQDKKNQPTTSKVQPKKPSKVQSAATGKQQTSMMTFFKKK